MNKMVEKRVGSNIRRIRESKGMTQDTLGCEASAEWLRYYQKRRRKN